MQNHQLYEVSPDLTKKIEALEKKQRDIMSPRALINSFFNNLERKQKERDVFSKKINLELESYFVPQWYKCKRNQCKIGVILFLILISFIYLASMFMNFSSKNSSIAVTTDKFIVETKTNITEVTTAISSESSKVSEDVVNFVQELYHFSIGDTVLFTGDSHYVSSLSDAEGSPCYGKLAIITLINPEGSHPYHLKCIEKNCNLWGWVDKDFLEKK